MKKILAVILSLVLALSFSACVKSNNDKPVEQKTTEPTGRIYYDKFGNEFISLETMPFYDKNGKKFYLTNQIEQTFEDENGGVYEGERCFVDTHGVFVYDIDNEIELIDALSAKGSDGRMYYPASTVRWTVDNVMINAFGMGEEIVPD